MGRTVMTHTRSPLKRQNPSYNKTGGTAYRRRAGGLVAYNPVWYVATSQTHLAPVCSRRGWAKTARLSDDEQVSIYVPAGAWPR